MGVNFAHDSYLVITLLYVGLVNTQCVNPDTDTTILLPDVDQGIYTVLSHLDYIVPTVDNMTRAVFWSSLLTPHIRKSCVFGRAGE